MIFLVTTKTTSVCVRLTIIDTESMIFIVVKTGFSHREAKSKICCQYLSQYSDTLFPNSQTKMSKSDTSIFRSLTMPKNAAFSLTLSKRKERRC